MAADVDTSRLARYCSLPQSSFNSLLDNPTQELVRALLKDLLVRADEYDEAKSNNVRLNVELENAVRSGETKTKVLRSSIDKAHKEAGDLRQKLQAEEAAKLALETEHQGLKVSTSSATEDRANLQARIASLQTSHRDTLSLLESKSSAYDTIASDLASEHQKNVDVRRQLSTLECSLQSANTSASNAKYREQALEQEVEHLKRSNDWLDNELKTKTEEQSKLRKDKNARIAELQRANEDQSNTIDSLRHTEAMLRSRLEELAQKADDAFSRIQDLQEEASRKESEFQIEIDSLKRLVDLMKSTVETEKRRQQELLEELEKTKDTASEDIGRIAAEAETEHREREAAENHITELEAQNEELEAKAQRLQDQVELPRHSPQMPNGTMTPDRRTPLSRMASPSPAKFRGPSTMTQLVSEYNQMKTELDAERRRNQKLSQTVDEMLSDLETRQPEVTELREEHARLETEVAEMTNLIDGIGKERDDASREARRHSGMLKAKTQEGELLRQQLRDLSSQIKVLLMEIHLRDQGAGAMSEQIRVQLERLAQGQIQDGDLDDSTATDRFISQNLVTFRRVSELEEQNSKLITLTRELGQRMELEEQSRQGAAEAAREQQELQEKYIRCKDEIKSLVTQSQSYIRERDMFRRMLSHRGQIPPGTDLGSLFGESVNAEGSVTPNRRDDSSNVEQSPNTKELADYAKLLKDMQNHFDAYRQESATDRSTLKAQVDDLSRTNTQLRSEINKSNSRVELTNERYNMAQANYKMLKSENAELQKRSQLHIENAAKLDLRTQQAAEDLIEAKNLVDSMRNESANLKAEKEFWKGIEKRLTDDNRGLQEEQSRLNALTTDLQRLLNEREFSDSETRRRLQEQIDKLEQDLQSAQKRLGEQVEENKQLLLRRDFESQQSQKRIDDLVTSLGSTREALIETKATRDHLEARVQDLTIELRSAEERLEVLRTVPVHRPRDDENGSPTSEHNAGGSTMGREQELCVEVSELKRDLELARHEVENSKSQIEQYKAISQSSEVELANLNETQELYKQETEKLMAEQNQKISQFEERLNDTNAELSSSNSELAKLRSEEAEVGRRLEEQKVAHETEINHLKDVAERHEAAAEFHLADLRSQTEITQQAQSNYETELMKHGETAKTLQSVRNDLNQNRMQLLENKGLLETNRAHLMQNEESWTESRERYENELAELRTGRENLQVQNKRLHQQLESVSAQISNLRKHAPGTEQDETATNNPSSSPDNLQEIIKYLRREKDIVDVQLEISNQEAKRVKQQLQYTQLQLDEVRLKLGQQQRLREENERTALNHNKLMETINELSTFRESNVTLRNELRQSQSALAAKTSDIEALQAQIEPIQTELREVKGELENTVADARLVTEDRDRWQQRAQTILQKYDRIDPAELEALKEKIQILEKEKEESHSSVATLQARIEDAEKQTAAATEQGAEKLADLKQRLTEQFKARNKEMMGKIREKDSQMQAATQDKSQLEAQIATLQEELQTARSERDHTVQRTASNEDPTSDDHESEEGQVMETDTSSTKQPLDSIVLQTQLYEAQGQARAAGARATELDVRVEELQAKIAGLESQLNKTRQALDKANAEMTALREAAAQRSSASAVPHQTDDRLTTLREKLSNTQKANENLRAAIAVDAMTDSVPQEQREKTMNDLVAENEGEIRAELEHRHNQRIAELEEEYKKRSDGMRTQLSRRLAEGKAEARKAIKEESDQMLEKTKAEHASEIESLNSRHQRELDELRRHLEERFEASKAEWQSSQSKGTTIDTPQIPPAQIDGQDDVVPQLSDAQARKLVASNATIKEIVKRNISAVIAKNKEANATQIKQECEKEWTKKISDAQEKLAKEKEQAVTMETKKSSARMSMLENGRRAALAKIEIVQTAAKDTPQRPVIEVWNVAKDAKAAPGPAAAPKPAATVTSHGPTVGDPQRNLQSPQSTIPTKAENVSSGELGAPSAKSPALNPSAQAFSPGNQQAPSAPPGSNAIQQQGQPSSASQAQPTPAQPQGPQGQPNGLPRLAQPSNIQPRPQGQQNAGAGHAVIRGLQQSGIPMARGSIRGGRVRGQGRGAPQSIDTTRVQGQGQGQGRGSPTSGRARQFVPSNKRPRDDGGDGGQEGDGKRIRGGGVGN